MTFDADALAARKLPYERLDQLVTELLLGVLITPPKLTDGYPWACSTKDHHGAPTLPGFLKLVQDAKSRVRECTVDDVKARLDRGEQVHPRRRARGKRVGQGPPARRGPSRQGRHRARRRGNASPTSRAELVLYCGGGFRSALAADNLQKMGYTNVLSMDGGMRGWREKGYPLTRD